MKQYPEQDLNHVIGDRALSVFNYYRRPYWIPNQSQRDYGWDIIITISEEGHAKEHFFVQLKGTESPKYIKKKTVISFPLEISTINFYALQRMPVLLCLCLVDIEGKRNDEPIYYVWIDDAIRDVEKEEIYRQDKEQKTINIHIPIANCFNKSACQRIEDDVRNYYKDHKIKEIIGDVFISALGKEATQEIYSSSEDIRKLIFEKIDPLQKAGIIDIIQDEDEREIEVFSIEDQAHFRKIQHISEALKDFNDRDVEKYLVKFSEEIKDASDAIKAKYNNARGILFLHKGEYEPAIHSFTEAHQLRPKEQKYVLNLLLAQYIATEEYESIALPDEWNDKLETILSASPDNYHAIRLKASYLAMKNSLQEAEDFLRNSVCWDREPILCRCYLATIYNSAGDILNAERLLREAEQLNFDLDANFWSLLGNVLLRKSIGFYDAISKFIIHGSGPDTLDIEILKNSAQCFQKAFKEFKEKRFPYFSSEMITNYAITLRLIGNLEEEEDICKIFLEYEPQHPDVNAALATCLAIQNKLRPAIKYAKIAYENDGNSSNYRILALCYLNTEAFEELLQLVEERQKSGFRDKEEEGFSLAFSAIVYNELGEYEQVQKILTRLQADTVLAKEIVFVESAIAKKNNEPQEKIINIYRNALKKYPDDVHILANYIDILRPVDRETAQEIIRCIKLITQQCQLTPKPIYRLVQAYILQDDFESADVVLESAIKRYPNEHEFLYERANVQVKLGNEELSFQLLRHYLEQGERSYTVFHNLAWLSSETNRLDDAIIFLEKSLSKLPDGKLRGAIHCQLYELRKKRGDHSKQILHHAIEFGKTVGSLEEEAKFLMMVLLTPHLEKFDEEVDVLLTDFRERLSKFSQEHPRFHLLHSLEIPINLSHEELIPYIKAQIAEIMLPFELESARWRLSARSNHYPLGLRSKYIEGGHSIFNYWMTCINSKKDEHAIHIWYPYNTFEREKKATAHRDSICIDITALLTLAELNMLEILPQYFTKIVIARGTKRSLQIELNSLKTPHLLAQKIEDWRIAYRQCIQIRAEIAVDDKEEEGNSYIKNDAGIFLRKDSPIDVVLNHGIGESLLLAQKLGIVFYSDDAAVRFWAVEEYGIEAFSSIALFQSLREEGYISIDRETTLLVEMIKKNFRIIPFDIIHLNSRLERIWEKTQEEGKSFSECNLNQDNILGVLIRHFAEPSIAEEKLIQVAISWWSSILTNEKFAETTILVKCIYVLIFCLSMRLENIQVTDIKGEEREIKIAFLLTIFLWSTYKSHGEYTDKAWSCIKDCVQELYYNDEERYQQTLYIFIPKCLFHLSRSDNSIENHKKLSFLIHLPYHFPQEDRIHFETILAHLLIR